MHLYQYEQKEITQHPLKCSEHPQGPSGLQAWLHTLRGAHPECKQPKNRNRQKTISGWRMAHQVNLSRTLEAGFLARAAASCPIPPGPVLNVQEKYPL